MFKICGPLRSHCGAFFQEGPQVKLLLKNRLERLRGFADLSLSFAGAHTHAHARAHAHMCEGRQKAPQSTARVVDFFLSDFKAVGCTCGALANSREKSSAKGPQKLRSQMRRAA